MAGEMGTSKAIIIVAVLIGGAILADDLAGNRYAFSANPGVGINNLIVWRLDTVTGDISGCVVVSVSKVKCP